MRVPQAENLVAELLARRIVESEPALTNGTHHQPAVDEVLTDLVRTGKLTPYQMRQARAGHVERLRLGPYRILDALRERPGHGVFLAEHVHLYHKVALRVYRAPAQPEPNWFHAACDRARAAAHLRQEQLIAVTDAGWLTRRAEAYGFFASPYIAGQDLDAWLTEVGPLPPARACPLVCDVARILEPAHKRGLAHGALRPASVRMQPDGRLAVVDFGLKPPPAEEEASGIAGDLRGLGVILCRALTGWPAPPRQNASVAPGGDVPPPLWDLCLALSGADGKPRIASVTALLNALQPFAPAETGSTLSPSLSPVQLAAPDVHHEHHVGRRVLIVDDEKTIRIYCAAVLREVGLTCDEAGDGLRAMEAYQRQAADLVLLDIDMPNLNGLEACRRLRRLGTRPHLKVVLMSGRSDPDVLAQMLLAGADDYLTKPFTPVQLQARVQAALRLQFAQERSDTFGHELRVMNRELEQHLQARDSDLVHARNALVLALAKLAESRDRETGTHLLRLQHFVRRLAEEAQVEPLFAGQMDDTYIDMLACCTPLHDIGKVGLPDSILLKPGKLTPDERRAMEDHTVIGAETLHQVARQHPFATAFLRMAVDIARHHHERYDGQGYPDRLAGDAIPLAARLVTICDVYDALRTARVYKPALPHEEVMGMMRGQAGTQFDPDLMACFERAAADFDRLYRQVTEETAAPPGEA